MQEHRCNKCDGPSHVKDICSKCNTKRALLSRMFGKWPIQSFNKLEKEEQLEFWQDDGMGATGILVDLTKSITKHRVQVRTDMMGGKYLPLTVYESMGYNTRDIEKNCVDAEEHPVLGTTYRVEIHEITSGEVSKEVETELEQLKLRGQKRGRSKERALGKKKKAKKSSSSSSRSSSSSAASEKSKKPKEVDTILFVFDFLFCFLTAGDSGSPVSHTWSLTYLEASKALEFYRFEGFPGPGVSQPRNFTGVLQRCRLPQPWSSTASEFHTHGVLQFGRLPKPWSFTAAEFHSTGVLQPCSFRALKFYSTGVKQPLGFMALFFL